MNARIFMPAWLVLGVLVACGGGGGGGGGNNNPPPPPPPAADPVIGGFYNGTLTICEVSGCIPHDYLMLVSEAGEYMAIDLTYKLVPIIGVLDVDGTEFEGSRDVYLLATDAAPFGFTPVNSPQATTGNASRGLRGSFIEGISITADYFHVSQLSDTQFLGNYDEGFDDASSLEAISGMYSADDGAGYSLTYAVDDAGNISGSDSTGCTISGGVALVDVSQNLYRTNFSFASCGVNGANGDGFQGLAMLRTSTTSMQQSLLFYASDGTNLVMMELPKI